MTLLVAEDDPLTRRALADILTAEGWNVVTAADGAKAWNLFEAGGIDLVCLDIMMPGRSGYDLCRKIREKNATVPLLFISAKAEEIDKVLGLELGADDFIVKPFGAREVVARIRAVLRRFERGASAEPQAKVWTLGPWTVDAQTMRAVSEDVSVDLTANVDVTMTLTSPACPVAGSLPGEVQNKIKSVPGVANAKVNLVWTPPWSKDMMSDAAKLQLNIM